MKKIFIHNYLNYLEDIVLVSSGNSMALKSLTFRNEFQKIYGKAPGAVAEYSFDGMSLLIDAIRSGDLIAKTYRMPLQKYILKVSPDQFSLMIKGNVQAQPN
jgi:hypothetical protein